MQRKEELDGKISNKAELKGKKVRFVKIDCDEEENDGEWDY